MLIHLNGFPGVGKRTVGLLVAEQLGGRFVHNHDIVNCALACTDRSEEVAYEQTIIDLTEFVFGRLAKRPSAEFQVVTQALADNEVDRRRLSTARRSASERGVTFVPILLVAGEKEILERASNSERSLWKKLTDLHTLKALMARYPDMLHDENEPYSYRIDTTGHTAEIISDMIVKHIAVIQKSEAQRGGVRNC
ncbi:MAG: hypothetical protein KTR25_04315 [Myxococcales bacterium]|nr:hypothetical protein [Myxococcales bacterium]